MRFHERFYGFRALSIIGKCTSRHLFAYGGLPSRDQQNKVKIHSKSLSVEL